MSRILRNGDHYLVGVCVCVYLRQSVSVTAISWGAVVQLISYAVLSFAASVLSHCHMSGGCELHAGRYNRNACCCCSCYCCCCSHFYSFVDCHFAHLSRNFDLSATGNPQNKL